MNLLNLCRCSQSTWPIPNYPPDAHLELVAATL
jgi:hypothetical protein